MKVDLRKLLVMLPVAALMLPVGLLAATKTCTPSNAATAEPSDWNSHAEASRLLDKMASRAEDVSSEVDGLADTARTDTLNWRIYSNRLVEVKSDVNSMGRTLCRLQTMQDQMLPWQKDAMDRIQTKVALLAIHTDNAIELLTHHQDTTWATSFPQQLSKIYDGANQISRSVDNFTEYAQVRHHYHTLERETGMAGS